MLREMDDPTSGDITVLLDGTAAQVVGEAPQTNFELAVQAAGSVADFVLGGRPRRQSARCTTAAGGSSTLRPTSTAAASCSTPWPGSRPNAQSAAARRRCASCARTAAGWRGTQILAWWPCRSIASSCAHCIALHREGLRVSVIHVVAGSFAPPRGLHRRPIPAPAGASDGHEPARWSLAAARRALPHAATRRRPALGACRSATAERSLADGSMKRSGKLLYLVCFAALAVVRRSACARVGRPSIAAAAGRRALAGRARRRARASSTAAPGRPP